MDEALPKSFVTSYQGLANVLINQIHVSKAFSLNPDQKIYQLDSNCKAYNAIWDTGATSTVITEKVAIECGLLPISATEVMTAGGTKRSNVYLINLWLPNKIVIPNLRVVEGLISGSEEALIGMDIISKGDFAVSNKDGKTIFTYRVPSMQKIDFVNNPYKELPITNPIKIGRNSPCPCGSGKKYKRCCGK